MLVHVVETGSTCLRGFGTLTLRFLVGNGKSVGKSERMCSEIISFLVKPKGILGRGVLVCCCEVTGCRSFKGELQLPLASCLEVATPIGDLGHKIAITSGDFMLIYTFQLCVF